MQHALRPYATAGVALIGASVIAVTPTVAQSPSVQMRQVKLVDAWSDLLTDTTTNLDKIIAGADASDISQVFSALLTNPLGVLSALTSVDPSVTTTAGTDPLLQVSVGLTPALELGLAQLGAEGATLQAINTVVGQLSADPSNALSILYEGTANILNAGLNGADNVSLLDGIINIPVFNGLLAPETALTVDLNLTDLINALGLGSLNLSNLDLTSLLSQLGLGDVNLDTLLTDLGISGDKLGDLLAGLSTPITSLGGLLNLLGLNSLGSGDGITLSLTNILTGLGLNPTTDVGDLTLSGLLSDLDLNTLGLGTLLSDAVTSGVFSSDPVLQTALTTLLGTSEGLLNEVNLGELLTGVTLGQGISGGLTVDDLLTDLGFPSTTGDLTLGTLLTDLGNPFGSVSITGLLDNLTLGGLIDDLGLGNTELDLTNLVGDLTNLNLGDLLGDLGLGNLADVTVTPFGGLITELVDTVPAQILAAL